MKDTKKIILIVVGVIVLVGGSSFYGGMKYGQSRVTSGFQNLQNLTPEQRQQRMQQMSNTNGGARLRQGFGGQGFVNGQIIAKDDKSVTIQLLNNGGSKIVFYSGSTQVGEFTVGTSNDLEMGKAVSVNGTVNSDGSITAQGIQIRLAEKK